MPKKSISQNDIIKIAEELVLADYNPTVGAIKARLNGGSVTTIYKYLSQWKQTCLKKMVVAIDCFDSPSNLNMLMEEKRNLEQTLQQQISKNERYAQELINAEKANIAVKEEINRLQGSNQELQLRLTQAEATNHVLEKITQKIQKELNLNTNETIRTMQQTIDGLRTELKTLNETSLIAVRETSNKGHEALMQEKVTNINLQTKIDSLTKELMESKKQLELANIKAHVYTQSLQRQIDQQQKILKNYLSSAQLQELAQGIGVNYILEASYGK